MGSFPPSGNRFGIRPSFSYLANVLSMDRASSYLRVERHTPGRAIIVSRPQSSKKGNPASIVSPPVDSRFAMNSDALFTRHFAVSVRNPACSSSPLLYAFCSSMICCAVSSASAIRLPALPLVWISDAADTSESAPPCPFPELSRENTTESSRYSPAFTEASIRQPAFALPVLRLPSQAS